MPADPRAPQWDARQPLQGAPRGLNRQVGVLVGPPFHHHGLNATYVDISRETPIVSTDMWGTCYPAAETEKHARAAFEKTIAELDGLIAHLTAHRDRLIADLASLPDREFGQQPAPLDLPEAMPAVPPAPKFVDVPLPLEA